MKYTTEQLKRFVRELREVELTGWQTGFVQDVGNKLDQRWALSKRQVEILERLYAEKSL